LAHKHRLKVFIPSSISSFGPDTPRVNTPDLTVQRPTTVYGISKVFVENLGTYYHRKYGVDFRSLRFPGVINAGKPGGGTTDYGVEMFYAALEGDHYNCWLAENSFLPMVYMDDCMDGTIAFLEAPRDKLTQSVYNMQGCSFSPNTLAEAIRRHYPNFKITCNPDPLRQSIADSWPASLDDSIARRDWNWNPKYDLENLVKVMFQCLKG